MDSDDDEDDSDEDDDEYVSLFSVYQSLYLPQRNNTYLPRISVTCTNNITIHFIHPIFSSSSFL